ncbi:MAG TPA: tetratricopeptide repeat protein, partial [Nitrososphaeraceae archaeon]|nr:tetratricopeptide repeat protein [Nitrososphaeraceae archaeon]
DEALECFDKASKIRPDFAYPLYNKGYLLSKLEKYDEAIECIDKALKISPNFPHAWYTKGYVLNSLKRYGEAITYFDRAIEIFYTDIKKIEDPNYLNLAYAYNNKGYALLSLERYKEALEFFDKAINIYETLKRKQYNKGTAIDLELAYAYNNKGYALNSLEKYDEAIKCYDKSVSIYETIECLDKHIEEIKRLGKDISYLKRGQAKYMRDDYRSALDDFRKINEDNRNLFGEKHNSVGLCYHKQQKIKKAEEEYIEATESNSKSIEATAYYNLGVLYNSENRKDKAQKMFENCLKVDPSFSKAKEAINKFEGSDQIEWYNWWFGHVKGKKALGMLLIASILTPIIMAGFISYHVYFVSHHISGLTSFINHNISVLLTGIISMMGISIAILLLPSLTKIKVGSVVELETVPITHSDNNIKLEASVSIPSLLSVSMPTEIPLQPFPMPLQSMSMPTKYPLKSTRMSLQSLQRI